MLNLNELRVFLAAAETENFSEAGRRLGMTQPGVSQHVRSLEGRFGIELFERSGRHVTITDAGRALVPLAKDLLLRGHRLHDSMATLHNEIAGELKMGCTTASGKYVLPRIFARFQALHPQVRFECLVNDRDRALGMLSTGELQLSMTSVRLPIAEIEYRPFVADRIVLITHPEHPWSDRSEPLSAKELATEGFVSREEGSGTVEAVRDGISHHDIRIEELQIIMVLSNSEAVRIAVAEGIGVGFVSSMVAAEYVRAGTVSLIEVENLDLVRTLYLARSTGHPATSAQRAFWEYAFSPDIDDIRRQPASIDFGRG